MIGQAVRHYIFIKISAPRPISVFDAPGKAITQFAFLGAYLQAEETLHQTGSAQCLMTSSILLYSHSCK